MTFRGKVKNGKVQLNPRGALPDGSDVIVRPVKKRKTPAKSRKSKAKAPPRSLADRLANVMGKATGLPPDASVNHDYYLYGAPKHR